MAAQGVILSEDLVKQTLERIKELRESQIETGFSKRAVEDYYSNYQKLGIDEAALIELVLEITKAPTPVSAD